MDQRLIAKRLGLVHVSYTSYGRLLHVLEANAQTPIMFDGQLFLEMLWLMLLPQRPDSIVYKGSEVGEVTL